MARTFVYFWVTLLVTLPVLLFADRIETKDGSTIYGKIIGASDGNLTVETTYLSIIQVPLSELVSLSSSSNIGVRDENNQTNFGQSVPLPENQLNLRNNKQTTTLDFTNIQHIWTETDKDPWVVEAEQEQLELMMQWKSSVGFDLVGSSGNTDSLGIGFRLDSTYANKFKELDLFLSYNTQTTNGATDTDETKGGVAYDSIFKERLAWYLRSDFEHDPVEQINLRSTGALGLKYDVLEDLDYQISTRLGTAVRYEESTIEQVGNELDPAFDLGLEYSHLVRESLFLESELTLLPKIDDLSDYLFNHDTALVFPILEDNTWHIRSGLSGTFDSIPKKDTEKMDMKYYFRVVYDFE
ncbi:MAG: DUF481 domain-containing protein [Opitutae bacterium]